MANLPLTLASVLFVSLISSCFTQSSERAKPSFIVEPQSIVNATEGETVELRCEAGGVPRPAVKWFYDGKPIPGARSSNPESTIYTKLVIEGATEGDSGIYGCNFSNALGYVYKEVQLNVWALPPMVVEFPPETPASPGEDVTLKCAASGLPKPEITWHLNANLKEKLSNDSKHSIDGSGGKLIVSKVEPGQSRYTCIARNKHGQAQTSTELVVKPDRSMDKVDRVVEVKVGEPIFFTCGPMMPNPGMPTTGIHWIKEGGFLDFDNDLRLARSTTNFLMVNIAARKSDAGTYTCFSTTGGRRCSSRVRVIVKDA